MFFLNTVFFFTFVLITLNWFLFKLEESNFYSKFFNLNVSTKIAETLRYGNAMIKQISQTNTLCNARLAKVQVFFDFYLIFITSC